MRKLHLWVPADRERYGRPRVIAYGSAPPQPGAVYEVEAKGAPEARRAYFLSLTQEPDRKKDKRGWVEWDTAQDAVSQVANYEHDEHGKLQEVTSA